MSSIYRKGRDGYFYYQTYIYNPETKKKDKRVFHALRTKDINDAKSKQNDLDLQYQEEADGNYNESNRNYNFTFKSVALIIFGTVVLTLITVYLFMPINKIKNSTLVSDNVQEKEEKYITDNQEVEEITKEQSNIQMSSKSEENTDKTKSINESEPTLQETLIPKYKIERVEKLSGAFEQGKIYVSVDESSSKESQLLLCKDLANRYSEFSSIIICLYADNNVGKNIAKGLNQLVSVPQQKQVWLAMYTYNTVEGEYFDNNPSSYLGNY